MPDSVDSNFDRPNWNRFWFSPASAIPLDRMRVAVGLLVVFWLLSFFGRQTEYFGFSGWLNRDAYSSVRKLQNGFAVPDSPASRLSASSWSPMYFATTPIAVHALYAASILAALAFTVGVAPVVAAPLTWLGVCSFTSNPVFNGAGVDSMLLVLTFYLMAGFILRRLLPTGVGDNLAMRMLQVHVAILIFSSGLGKLQQSIWWEGIALWFPRNPPYELPIETINKLRESGGVGSELRFLSFAAYLVLMWQLSFPALAFQRWTRTWIVGGAFFGMIGCWYVYRLPMFGPTWFVASLAFLNAEDWKAIGAKFGRSRASPVSEAGGTS